MKGQMNLFPEEYKQIQLWFNVDCTADNDVVFLPDRRYK